MVNSRFYLSYVKRLLDLIFSGLMIIFLSPFFLIVSILVFFKLGRPIIFKQKRIGLKGQSFYMYKFRTMTNEKDNNGNLLPNELRLTRLGKIIRAASLDELPELLNILKGEMSFIGPRPLVERYRDFFSKEEMKRHDVRPGLTGLAQVNGRSFISWEEIFDYDLYYVNNVNILMDFQIVIATVNKVFSHENVADLSKIIRDEEGNYWIEKNGKKIRVHGALDEERGNI